MRKYNVSSARIDDGVITTDFFDKAETISGFLKDKAPIIEVFDVTGWKFSKIHLTHGTQKNGAGWAFYK